MAEAPGSPPPYSGQQLWGLTRRLRLLVFRATLVLAALLALPAAAMIALVGKEVGVRLAMLAILAGLCAFGAVRAGWCAERLRRRPGLLLVVALLGAGALVAGGARQDATFLVIAAVLVGAPAIVEVRSAMGAGAIVALAYAASIAIRGEAFLLDGSAGDLAALLSLLVAIYAAHRAAELATMTVVDVNRDARDAATEVGEAMPASRRGRFVEADGSRDPVSVRVISQEATDGTRVEALRRLSEVGLTPAQQEVALLAGDGLQQKLIAERLEKSTKTIEHQLRAIKDKLEVRNHPELTAEIHRILALPPDRQGSEDDAPPQGAAAGRA